MEYQFDVTQELLWHVLYLTVNFDLESSTASPAMISYTKKPKKKGFSFKKVFK